MFSLDWFLFLQRSLSNVVNDGVKLEDTNSVERRQENCQSLFEVQRIKDLVLSLLQFKSIPGAGSIPGPGISICPRHGQIKNKKHDILKQYYLTAKI